MNTPTSEQLQEFMKRQGWQSAKGSNRVYQFEKYIVNDNLSGSWSYIDTDVAEELYALLADKLAPVESKLHSGECLADVPIRDRLVVCQGCKTDQINQVLAKRREEAGL